MLRLSPYIPFGCVYFIIALLNYLWHYLKTHRHIELKSGLTLNIIWTTISMDRRIRKNHSPPCPTDCVKTKILTEQNNVKGKTNEMFTCATRRPELWKSSVCLAVDCSFCITHPILCKTVTTFTGICYTTAITKICLVFVSFCLNFSHACGPA